MPLWLLRPAAPLQMLRGQHGILRQQFRQQRLGKPPALARSVPALVRGEPEVRAVNEFRFHSFTVNEALIVLLHLIVYENTFKHFILLK